MVRIRVGVIAEVTVVVEEIEDGCVCDGGAYILQYLVMDGENLKDADVLVKAIRRCGWGSSGKNAWVMVR